MPASYALKNEWRAYYVVFQKSKYSRPWHILTWNGFEHCWVFFAHYDGPAGLLTKKYTMKAEPLSTYLSLDFWKADPEEVAEEFLKEDCVLDIIKISLRLPLSAGYSVRGLINCVTVIKSVLGISKWFVFTPQQLRRYLLKLGGQSLNK